MKVIVLRDVFVFVRIFCMIDLFLAPCIFKTILHCAFSKQWTSSREDPTVKPEYNFQQCVVCQSLASNVTLHLRSLFIALTHKALSRRCALSPDCFIKVEHSICKAPNLVQTLRWALRYGVLGWRPLPWDCLSSKKRSLLNNWRYNFKISKR